ncbi:MAG: hypothetical protein M5U28_46785 [Sandaracinaceae bacterium]|nr:hypothetical protein [Sandaracinaceae bacterium]
MRTTDLPLFDPPRPRLRARWAGDAIEVDLEGVPEHVSLRWVADGPILAMGTKVRWAPSSSADQLRVAVRSEGGVAITSIRAAQVR